MKTLLQESNSIIESYWCTIFSFICEFKSKQSKLPQTKNIKLNIFSFVKDGDHIAAILPICTY